MKLIQQTMDDTKVVELEFEFKFKIAMVVLYQWNCHHFMISSTNVSCTTINLKM